MITIFWKNSTWKKNDMKWTMHGMCYFADDIRDFPNSVSVEYRHFHTSWEKTRCFNTHKSVWSDTSRLFNTQNRGSLFLVHGVTLHGVARNHTLTIQTIFSTPIFQWRLLHSLFDSAQSPHFLTVLINCFNFFRG